MAKKLGILMIRGSGSPGFKEQETFIKRLFSLLRKQGEDPVRDIATQMVDWYGPLETEQQKLIRRLENSGLKVRGRGLRRFLLSNIGDLINYGGRPNRPSTTYEQIHQLVTNDIRSLQDQLRPDAPLIVLASSMGTEVINNHIWDRQQFKVRNPGMPDPMGKTAFERMETLVGLFTFGNNIPIFGAALTIEDLEPIRFPDTDLPAELMLLSEWINIYDKNDPLGYPVTFVNQQYGDGRVKDVEYNVGNLFTSWNIASHFYYWKSRKVCKRVSSFSVRILNTI